MAPRRPPMKSVGYKARAPDQAKMDRNPMKTHGSILLEQPLSVKSRVSRHPARAEPFLLLLI